MVKYTQEEVEVFRKKWAGVFKEEYTEEEIEELRARWIGLDSVIKKVVAILKKDSNIFRLGMDDAYMKLQNADSYLDQNGFKSDRSKQISYELNKKIKSIPQLDLRGINLCKRDCNNFFGDFTLFQGALCDSANLSGSQLNYANFDYARLIHANLSKSMLNDASFKHADLCHANIQESQIMMANLSFAMLMFTSSAKANYTHSILHGANLNTIRAQGAIFQNADLSNSILQHGNFEGANLSSANLCDTDLLCASFKNANLGNIIWHKTPKKRFLVLWRAFYDGVPKTVTGLGIEGASFASSRHFERYIKDEQYIGELKEKSKINWYLKMILSLWRCSSNYGRSFGKWAEWSLLFATIWGFAYKLIGPAKFNLGGEEWSWFAPFYYSIVTFTTLGFGDITPKIDCWWLQIIVTLEVIMGYIMLGGLISIFANKLARRS